MNACTDGRSLESSAPLQKRSSEANKCAGGLDAAGGGVRGLVGDACGAGCQCHEGKRLGNPASQAQSLPLPLRHHR